VIHLGRRRRIRGFSLVEMMMATAILSVMIALSAIGMITMRRQAYVNGETQRLVQRLRETRNRAIGLATHAQKLPRPPGRGTRGIM